MGKERGEGARRGGRVPELTLREISVKGHRGPRLTPLDVPAEGAERLLPPDRLRSQAPGLPEISEPAAVRHFVNLSVLNHHIDKAIYPLGSCTMKYNPKLNDEVAQLPGLQAIHPFQSEDLSQGALAVIWELHEWLKVIMGMPAITTQPAAGAQCELAALLMTRAYHAERGNPREEVIVPDSAHGTNPSTANQVGYRAVTVPSGPDGCVDIEALKREVSGKTAALMLTNPNTLGIFERQVGEIARIVHGVGGLLYLDGANLNAMVGLASPGTMGFDFAHINLHKTFSTPHGGGGPGGGVLCVRDELAPYLPTPVLERSGDRYTWSTDRPRSIGRVHSYYGNFGMLVRALCYVKSLGASGLAEVSREAILNANYLKARLREAFVPSHEGYCMHEFVLSASRQKARGVRALDLAKRLLDFGMHAPTTYFPLIVDEALMIEPTETETKASLDAFADALLAIDEETREDPDRVKQAPTRTPVRRLDEARAARKLTLTWRDLEDAVGG
ncbi:MAG TPA: aminomethyl-transferring glycine dehydrogenase subunit GcvPB, partial [Candidatus Limnocylindrales bacterium]|nr:aminomethyl-transferring glycine dehydrogenase subunit GcvPB [Candidatus Limnocylindrales bacterium]